MKLIEAMSRSLPERQMLGMWNEHTRQCELVILPEKAR